MRLDIGVCLTGHLGQYILRYRTVAGSLPLENSWLGSYGQLAHEFVDFANPARTIFCLRLAEILAQIWGLGADLPVAPQIFHLTGQLNIFRQNVQPGGLFNAPDASVPSMVCGQSQDMQNAIDIQVAVKNSGAELLPLGTAIHIELDKDGMIIPLTDTATTQDLLPGQFELLELTIMLPMNVPQPPYVIRAIADPDNAVNECVEDNNNGEASCVVVQ